MWKLLGICEEFTLLSREITNMIINEVQIQILKRKASTCVTITATQLSEGNPKTKFSKLKRTTKMTRLVRVQEGNVRGESDRLAYVSRTGRKK